MTERAGNIQIHPRASPICVSKLDTHQTAQDVIKSMFFRRMVVLGVRSIVESCVKRSKDATAM